MLRCLGHVEIPVALQEPHARYYGGHLSGNSLVNKLVQMGYYWHTMEQDFFAFVKKLLQWKQHANLIHARM